MYGIFVSYLKVVRFSLANRGLTLITSLVLSFLSFSPSFFRLYFPCQRFFLFTLFPPSDFSVALPALIVSLPLCSSYSSTFRLLPYLWIHFTPCSSSYTCTLRYSYLYFLCVSRISNIPATLLVSRSRERSTRRPSACDFIRINKIVSR